LFENNFRKLAGALRYRVAKKLLSSPRKLHRNSRWNKGGYMVWKNWISARNRQHYLQRSKIKR